MQTTEWAPLGLRRLIQKIWHTTWRAQGLPGPHIWQCDHRHPWPIWGEDVPRSKGWVQRGKLGHRSPSTSQERHMHCSHQRRGLPWGWRAFYQTCLPTFGFEAQLPNNWTLIWLLRHFDTGKESVLSRETRFPNIKKGCPHMIISYVGILLDFRKGKSPRFTLCIKTTRFCTWEAADHTGNNCHAPVNLQKASSP